MSRSIAFIHVTKAALDPVSEYFKDLPELDVQHILDEGIQSHLSAGAIGKAEEELSKHIKSLSRKDAVVLTCSAIPVEVMERLRAASAAKVLKIDEPMARSAIQRGRKIGLVVTFSPALKPIKELLSDVTSQYGTFVDIKEKVVPEAYEALKRGDTDYHDELVIDAIKELYELDLDLIILGQVSMTRVINRLEPELGKIVISSLSSISSEINELLAEKR
jgi:Asp/Glu/hydantoin racemase